MQIRCVKRGLMISPRGSDYLTRVVAHHADTTLQCEVGAKDTATPRYRQSPNTLLHTPILYQHTSTSKGRAPSFNATISATQYLKVGDHNVIFLAPTTNKHGKRLPAFCSTCWQESLVADIHFSHSRAAVQSVISCYSPRSTLVIGIALACGSRPRRCTGMHFLHLAALHQNANRTECLPLFA